MKGLFQHTLAITLLCSWQSLAQNPGQIPLLDRVTDGVEQVPQIKIAAEHMAWFQTHRYGAAYIDEMDLRIGGITDEDNELAFRIKPTNPFLFAAGRSLGKNMEKRASLSYRQAMEAVLYRRYESWLEVWFRSSTLRQIQQAAAWREQWSENTHQLLGNDEFDPEELLDIEIDRINLRMDDLKEQDKLLDELTSFYKETAAPDLIDSLMSPADPDVTNQNFPSLAPEKLQERLIQLQAEPFLQSLELEELQLDIEQSGIRVEMEKMDWDIGFVQPEWDNNGAENFSLRLGIGIPLFRPNRLQMQTRQLESFDEKRKEMESRIEWEQETAEIRREMESLVNRLSSLENLKVRLNELQQGIPLIEGKEAREILLKWLKANEKLDQQLLEDQFLLLTAYLEYLKLTGRLTGASSTAYFENIWTTNSY